MTAVSLYFYRCEHKGFGMYYLVFKLSSYYHQILRTSPKRYSFLWVSNLLLTLPQASQTAGWTCVFEEIKKEHFVLKEVHYVLGNKRHFVSLVGPFGCIWKRSAFLYRWCCRLRHAWITLRIESKGLYFFSYNVKIQRLYIICKICTCLAFNCSNIPIY